MKGWGGEGWGGERYPTDGRQMEKARGRCGGGCHCCVLSDKWVFTCLQPPPRCNKSWHLFVTYDCISDCLGRDSIPTPRSAGDGGIVGLEWWRNRGVCGSKASTNATLYPGEGYGRCLCVCVLHGESLGGGKAKKKIGMGVAHLSAAFRRSGWHVGGDGWISGWMANYGLPQGLHLVQSSFVGHCSGKPAGLCARASGIRRSASG